MFWVTKKAPKNLVWVVCAEWKILAWGGGVPYLEHGVCNLWGVADEWWFK